MPAPRTETAARRRFFISPDWLPRWETLLAGILIVAAYPPWDLRILIWVSLIPWFFALRRASNLRQAFFQGVWFSVFMSLLGFYWVAFVLHHFADLPWAVAGTGLFVYSLVGQPQFLLFGPLFVLARRWGERTGLLKTKAGILIWSIGVGLLYTGVDWFLPKLFHDTLGHAFYSAVWIRQSADLGGAHLLTFAAFWINLGIFLVLESYRDRVREKKLAPVLNLTATCAFALALTVYGYFRNEEIQKLLAHPESTVQAAIIQANIGDFDKVAAEKGIQEAAEKILADYFALSEQALSLSPKPDFIIWPETSYASTFRKPMTTGDYLRDQRIDTWVKNHDIPFLFGSYDRDNGKDFNAFFVLSPHPLSQALLAPEHSVGTDLQFYHKNMLLPFGEFIPLQDHFPIVGQWFPQVANFGRGIGPDVLKLPIFTDHDLARTIPISPLICYEVLFPNYVIDAANKGSRIIVNVTNDSWFGPNGEPDLHFALSIFRSVETRLPMVRSTNTGYSAVVLPDGEIINRSKLFEPEILNVSVPMIAPPPTLIKRWGDWYGKFSLVVGLLSFLGLGLAAKEIK